MSFDTTSVERAALVRAVLRDLAPGMSASPADA